MQLGTGRISPHHFAAVKALPEDIKIVAACDLEPEKIPNDVPRYIDYRMMIDEVKPDLVAIATDSGSHAKIGLYCLSKGAHCIIEKPLALSIEDADLLIKASEKHNRVLAVCHQNRFNKSVRKVREAYVSGRFGRLSHIAAHVRWNRGDNYYEQAPWRGKWSTDGGCLMNQCIHNLDLLQWFLGDIEEVTAYTSNRQHAVMEGEDVGIALLKAKDGTLGLFEGTVNVYPKNLEETLYIFGEAGTVKIAGTSVNLIDEWNFRDGLDDSYTVKEEYKENPTSVYGFGHTPFYIDVVDAIKNGRRPDICGKEGKKAMELVLAIYKSSLTGVPVKLPLEKFSTIDMIKGE